MIPPAPGLVCRNRGTHTINFDFNNTGIRVIEIDNQPWFVAADVAEALGFTYDNLKYHAKQTLGFEEKRVVKLPGFRGNGGTIISESGLYKLVMRSDKPEARAFQDWVTKVVLPAIRTSSEGTPCEPCQNSPRHHSSKLLIFSEPYSTM